MTSLSQFKGLQMRARQGSVPFNDVELVKFPLNVVYPHTEFLNRRGSVGTFCCQSDYSQAY